MLCIWYAEQSYRHIVNNSLIGSNHLKNFDLLCVQRHYRGLDLKQKDKGKFLSVGEKRA